MVKITLSKKKLSKLYVKLKPPQGDMYRQYLVITLKLKQINM